MEGRDIHNTVGLRDTEKPDRGRNDQDDSEKLPLPRRKIESSGDMGLATRAEASRSSFTTLVCVEMIVSRMRKPLRCRSRLRMAARRGSLAACSHAARHCVCSERDEWGRSQRKKGSEGRKGGKGGQEEQSVVVGERRRGWTVDVDPQLQRSPV